MRVTLCLLAALLWSGSTLALTPPRERSLPLPTPQLTVSGAGSPVVLTGLRVEAEIAGASAVTTLEMTFFNPNGRTLEGELQFPLLEGQQVVGFALELAGQMREAVPVEKAKGQAVFEEVTRARIDPALLEQTAGNNYKLRVYPLLPNATKRVRLSYSETLPAAGDMRSYRLPLAYGQLEAVDINLLVREPGRRPQVTGPAGLALEALGSDYRVSAKRADFAARGLLELQVPVSPAPAIATQSVEGTRYFLAEIPAPREPSQPRTLPGRVQLLWDASGSGAARDHGREFALLDAYFRRLGEGEVLLQRLRESAEPIERFSIKGGDWSALRSALERTVYDGATQLGSWQSAAEAGELLLFSDGLDTFGDKPITPAAVPLFAVNAALRNDFARLRRLAEASGGGAIDLSVGSAEAAAAQLLNHTPRIVEMAGDGIDRLVTASRYPGDGRWQVAGRLQGEGATLRLRYADGAGKPHSIELPIGSGENGLIAAQRWAQLRIDELSAEYRINRAEIRRLGLAHRLPTRESSLIVLDRVEDYARFGIEPPAELLADYRRLREAATGAEDQAKARHLQEVIRRFEEKVAWWNKEFPTEPPKRKQAEERAETTVGAGILSELPRERSPERGPREEAVMDMAPPARPAPAPAAPAAKVGSGDTRRGAITIQLKAASPDAPYARRMGEARPEEIYRIYLDERPDYQNSTAFFLDAADLLFEKGQQALGLRVLTNLAEMDLENRHILRILGYRLVQAKAPALAVPVFRRVLELAPDEPQSYRDLGLALAADGRGQEAIEKLYEVVVRPWHDRFPDVELIALAELNAIIATAPAPLDTRRIDPRLLRNLPLDLRVLLTWDADNTDIDLWVTDPNGEKAFYGHTLTYQGGRMSRDFTGGYGPEEFALKRALPGKYRVEANFFGHRQQVVAGATTLQVKLTTRFGTADAREEMITLRLKGPAEVVYVGEFEVK